ncbi:MAG: ABC transporter permease, partial [Polaromonas sp.]|nr:ABC transporter permease [Polaromonas sp.]
LPRALMRRERDTQLADLMPAVMVISLMVGALLFVTLPSTLGDAYLSALATLWPVWVIQAAPIAAAQVLAMQRAPTLALELSQRHSRGEFDALANLNANPAAYPCVPILAAHATVTAAASFLLIALTLILGVLSAFVLAVGDLRQSIDAVFSLVSPLQWLRSLVTAALLGLACSLATMLYAWPGTQTATGATGGVTAHRLGMQTMIVSSLSTIAAALTLNWVIGLLGFLKWWS